MIIYIDAYEYKRVPQYTRARALETVRTFAAA